MPEAAENALSSTPLKPDNRCLEASHLGDLHRARGEWEAAAQCYLRVLTLSPNDATALNSLGTVRWMQGRLEEAVLCYRTAVTAIPDYAMAHYNLGTLLQQRGDLNGALIHCSRAVQLNSTDVDALFNLGNVQHARRELDAASETYRRALAISPNPALAYNNLGNIAVDQGDAARALECYRAAAAAWPEFALAHYNLSGLLQMRGELTEAASHAQRAVELDSQDADAHFRLATILDRQGQFAAAALSYERAVERNPTHAQAHTNLGLLHLNGGKTSQAAVSFNRALCARPDHAKAHLGRALTDLALGNWERGWTEYEWRWRVKDAAPPLPTNGQPIWRGSALGGARILLVDEQGIGDALQFIRYASLVAARGGHVILRVRSSLRRLLENAPGIECISTFEEPLPTFDTYCPLLSLPIALGTTPQTVPATVPYLSAESDRVLAWRERLGAKGFRVGLCWQGSSKRTGMGRSFPLAECLPLSQVEGVRLISVQKFDGLEQLENLPSGMAIETLGVNFDSGPDALLDAAAVLESLDLLVTCDTAIAHLAGALGRPAWVALQHVPDWRWMRDRPDSPWYPSLRLFRQAEDGRWSDVFETMRSLLKEELLQRTGAARPSDACAAPAVIEA